MKYFHEQKKYYTGKNGCVYECDTPLYSKCTLYLIGDKGLAVIQQRYDACMKATYWTEVDPDLQDEIYLHPRFLQYFNKYAAAPRNDIYPTVTVRQIMWNLKIKPIKRRVWETVFDKCPVLW